MMPSPDPRKRMPIVSFCFFISVPLMLAYAVWEGAGGSGNIPHRLPLEGHQEKLQKISSTRPTRHERIVQMSDTANPQVQFQYSFNALDPLLAVSVSASNRFDPKDEYFGLPRNDGYELVSDYCSVCHSLRIVMQQRASGERWQELLIWMNEKQGMAALAQDEQSLLVRYLAKNFGTE